MVHYLDFEQKVSVIENKITDLQNTEKSNSDINFEKEINSLQAQATKMLESLYSNLSPSEKVSVARHPDRPHARDYINNIVSNFVELAGDRLFADDKAIIAGLGKINNESFMILGIEKGSDTESRIKHNFGMPKPEGYRKAQRIMLLADKLKLPIVTFVDTSGAYPGKEAEERGQGEAIAKSIATCLEITTPMINIIIGEGGSGGAIALAAGDCVMMLEHSIYSVISPEGCASILYRDDKMAMEAAKNLALTAQNLLGYNIIDKIITEPIGGAHRNKSQQYESVKEEIYLSLQELKIFSEIERKERKHQRFLNIGKLNTVKANKKKNIKLKLK